MRIALSILSLGLSVWALPALATPFHPTHSNGKSKAGALRFSKHLALDLRIDAKDMGSIYGSPGAKSARYERADYQGDWNARWTPRLGSGDLGTAVPEPSAVILFGAGLLLAQQAIPRRSSRASVPHGEGGAPRYG